MSDVAATMPPQNDGGTAPIEGLHTIDELDRRTRPFKRYTAIREAILSDLGGEEVVSEVRKQLVSKFATLAMRLEAFEAAAMAGVEIDADLFGRTSGHLRRLAEAIGLSRVPRDVTDLQTYLGQRDRQASDAEGAAA